MAIFLLLFAIAVSYVFTWTQDQGTIVDAIRLQTDTDKVRLSESLTVTALNNSALIVSDPTSQAAVVTQIWSNHALLWSGEQSISPFGNFIFNNATSPNTGWNAANVNLSNGDFQIVTLAGNPFSGSIQSQFAEATARSWQVTWYWYSYNSGWPLTPYLFVTNANKTIATSYWYDLNFYWEWSVLSNPVIANYNLSSSPPPPYNFIGFNATTTVIKTTTSSYNAAINYNIDNKSQVQFAVDGVLQSPGTNPVTFNGTQYSLHTISVYYFMNTTSVNDVAYLKLSITNATFAP